MAGQMRADGDEEAASQFEQLTPPQLQEFINQSLYKTSGDYQKEFGTPKPGPKMYVDVNGYQRYLGGPNANQRVNPDIVKEQKSPLVQVNQAPNLKPGQVLRQGPSKPDGSSPDQWIEELPVRGPDVEAAVEAEKAREGVRTTQKAEKANVMLNATSSITDLINGSGPFSPVVGTNSILLAMHSDTGAGKLRSHVATLRSGVAIQAMTRLKEASKTGATGFGQLNRAELQLLLDDMGARP